MVGTVQVAVYGVAVPAGQWSVDNTTGLVITAANLVRSTYTSGGTVQTRPLAGEAVKGGCEFDTLCPFADNLSAEFSNLNTLDTSFQTMAILNP